MSVQICPIRDVARDEYPAAYCDECPLRKTGMSNQSLREAAQRHWDGSGIVRNALQALKDALAQPDDKAQPVDACAHECIAVVVAFGL